MTTETQHLIDRITEGLAQSVRPPVYVEIVDPSGRVSYRRWSDHPDVQEALGTQGYTVRRCDEQPDLNGGLYPDRALLAESLARLRTLEATIAAQAEALARVQEAGRAVLVEFDGNRLRPIAPFAEQERMKATRETVQALRAALGAHS